MLKSGVNRVYQNTAEYQAYKLPVPERHTYLDKSRQGPTALAVGAGGVVRTFFLSSIISLFFLPLSRRRPDID